MAPETLSAYYEGIVEATFTAAEGTGMAGRVLKVRSFSIGSVNSVIDEGGYD